MTDQTSPDQADAAVQATPPPPPASESGPSFEQRMERFGQEAEEAGKRIAANPAVTDAADTATRVWGLIVLGIGLWFLAEVTLGYDMPAIPWRDIWPVGLIVIGLAVVLRGMARRRT